MSSNKTSVVSNSPAMAMDTWKQVPINKPLPTETEEQLDMPIDDLEYFAPPPQQTFLEKLWAKSKKEPFIPIGLVATSGCLGYGMWSMAQGNQKRQQLMMRSRVGAQAFTLAAFVFGLWSIRKKEEASNPPPAVKTSK